MNNNLFVPFELAKKLKEMGFNEKCNSGFHEDFGELENDNYLSLGTWSFLKDFNCDNSKDFIICQPLYSQVFQWLRNKHKVIGAVIPKIYKGEIVYSWYYIEKHTPTVLSQRYPELTEKQCYKTYEEAEEQLLTKILNEFNKLKQ